MFNTSFFEFSLFSIHKHSINEFKDASEFIKYGAYSLLSIDTILNRLEVEAFKKQTFTIADSLLKNSLWNFSFILPDKLSFLEGSPYDKIKILERDDYSIVLCEYIKRTQEYDILLDEIRNKIASSKASAHTFNILPISPYEFGISFNLDLFADITNLKNSIDKLDKLYSFLNAYIQQIKNTNFQEIYINFKITKNITKNIKVDAEIKRLMCYDIVEACEYVKNNNIEIENQKHKELFTKSKAIDLIAKYFYYDNDIDTSRNQVYKIHREAKQRVHDKALESYFI